MRILLFACLLAATGWAHAQNNITHYEYWYDQDDDDASRTMVAVASPAQTIDLINQSPDVSALPVGPHRIHYRLRDSLGHWSSVLRRDFMRLPGGPYHIVGIEYWFDQNDAETERFYQDVQPPASPMDLTVDIDAIDVPIGPHRIHYRLKDSHGAWSSVLRRDFRRNHDAPHEIVALRYWSDQATNPPADMIEVPIPDPAQFIDVLWNLQFCTYEQTGNTVVFYQLKDNHGQWSSVVRDTIMIDAVGQAPGTPLIEGLTGLCPDSTYTYTAQAPGGAWFEWQFPMNWTIVLQSGDSIQVTTPATVDAAVISVVAYNDCSESVAGTLSVGPLCTTSILTTNAASGNGLYPNPNSGQFFLELTSTAQVAVFDASGRQITAEQVLQGTRHTVDLGDAPDGVYSVRIIQDGRVAVRRFIVQH